MLGKRLWVLMCLMALLTLGLAAAGCSSSDDDDDNDAADDDATDDDASPADDDDASPADDDDDDAPTWTTDHTVVVLTPDGEVSVDFADLETFVWTDPDDNTAKIAVLVKTVVDAAMAKAYDPADYKFNFIATDGYNLLSKKLDGDYRTLPFYADLEKGWFIEYDETGEKVIDLEVVWDESLGYENFMGAKMMNGGTIEMVENVLFTEDVNITVDYGTAKGKATVNLNGLPAFYDEANSEFAVYLHHIVWEAALADFDPKNNDYNFNFISNDADGNWSLADNLGDGDILPVWQDYDTNKDIHHGWIENTADDGYRLFWDEATGFPGKYGVKFMDEGTIEVFLLAPAK